MQDKVQNRLSRPLHTFDPPKWPAYHSEKEIYYICKAVIGFLDLAIESIELVEQLCKNYVNMCQSVIKEYYDVVCIPTLSLARNASFYDCTKLEQQIHVLEVKLSISSTLVYHRQTMFDVVFKAILAKYALGSDFHHKVNSDERVTRWLQLGKKHDLLPLTVCFDIEDKIVGTTVSPWAGCRILNHWERYVRTETLNSEVHS
jgi:hypothetical protein